MVAGLIGETTAFILCELLGRNDRRGACHGRITGRDVRALKALEHDLVDITVALILWESLGRHKGRGVSHGGVRCLLQTTPTPGWGGAP